MSQGHSIRIAVGASTIALALTLGLGDTASAQQVSIEALEEQYAREAKRAAARAYVAENRESVLANLVRVWAATAEAKGHPASWVEELATVVRRAPVENLLAAEQAVTFDGAVGTLLGGQRVVHGPRVFGDTFGDLVFYALAPCRLWDSRLAFGPLVPGVPRDYLVNGGLTGQGGNPAGCGVPTDPKAVVITLTVTQPLGFGNLRAWAFGDPVPLASVINFDPGTLSVANTTVVPICQLCGPDLTVQADVAGAHVLADVVGYFWSPEATALDITTVSSSASAGALGGVFTRSVNCPGGRTVTGGGFEYVSGAGSFTVTRSEANGNGGWICGGVIGIGGGTVECEAVCSRVPGR